MRVLLTRPEGKNEALAEQLESSVAFVGWQSVIDIVVGPDVESINEFLAQKQQVLIFVSINAVTFLRQAIEVIESALIDEEILENCQLVAVGQSTAKTLQKWLNRSVITPKVETSEGLLEVDMLQKAAICSKKVTIVRGVGGRELLAEKLTERGATVNYWQVYHRKAIQGQGESWFEQFQTWQIDTIVVTSIAIAHALISGLPSQAKPWWQKLCWVCASSRIAEFIERQEVPNNQIYVASGANNAAILQQVKKINEDRDVQART